MKFGIVRIDIMKNQIYLTVRDHKRKLLVQLQKMRDIEYNEKINERGEKETHILIRDDRSENE